MDSSGETPFSKMELCAKSVLTQDTAQGNMDGHVKSDECKDCRIYMAKVAELKSYGTAIQWHTMAHECNKCGGQFSFSNQRQTNEAKKERNHMSESNS